MNELAAREGFSKFTVRGFESGYLLNIFRNFIVSYLSIFAASDVLLVSGIALRQLAPGDTPKIRRARGLRALPLAGNLLTNNY